MSYSSSTIFRQIRKGESETLEFKETFGKAVIETTCAFANSHGGVILIGVADHGYVRGIQTSKSNLKDWANQISQGTGLHPSIQLCRIKDKTVIRILVGVTWDELPEARATLADISMTKFRAFLRLANEVGRRPVPALASSTSGLLEKLGLIREGKPTRGAVLLFGKSPQSFYPLALVKAGRFRDETLILDDREIGGTLFEQVEVIMRYFRERLETRFERTGAPRRTVIWEYPLDALREAVINAICHRDYLVNSHTQVRIYDRELMVSNPGGLPVELSIKELKKRHPSIPRNRLIASIFYYAGLIEQWGSGIEKMIRACRTAELPQPIFEEDAGFRVTFRRSTPQAPPKYPPS